MEKNGRKGAMYAEPVEWVLPAGGKIIDNLGIISKNLHRNNLGKAGSKKLLNIEDLLCFSKPVFIKTTYFVDNLEIYFPRKSRQANMSNDQRLLPGGPCKNFAKNKASFISGKSLHQNIMNQPATLYEILLV